MKVKITKHYLTWCPFCDSEIIYSEADICGRPHHLGPRNAPYYFDTMEQLGAAYTPRVIGFNCPVCDHAIKHEEKNLLSVEEEKYLGIKDEYINLYDL